MDGNGIGTGTEMNDKETTGTTKDFIRARVGRGEGRATGLIF